MDASRPQAAAAGVELQLDEPDFPVHVTVDAARLQQVIVNLAHNAINHSEPGQTVEVSLGVEQPNALIRVVDNGSGIPSEALEWIFEPFFQASARSKSGMGLGLSLARAIVQAHGGDIDVTSEGAGQGAAFTVRLPLPKKGGDASSEVEPSPMTSADKVTVVLVDDDDASRENIAILLSDAGYNVHEARTGREGLQLIKSLVPSVAVVDVGLPDMNGLDVVRKVRQEHGPKQIRLLALTGFGQQSDREAAVEAGCDMHLVKPIDFATLERVIAYQASR